MTTVRDQIFAAIVAALTAIPGQSADSVELEPSGDPAIFPGLAVFDGGHSVLEREAYITRRRMAITVEGYVERGDGEEASAERNALHAAVVHALMADDTLGGLVECVDDADLRLMTAVLAESRRLSFAQDFEIDFTTSRTNPALPG